MTLATLLQWWNLIFIVPFFLALMYLGVYTLSGWTFGHADADVDHDLDADADVDHDIDADADADVDHDVDADADADADHDADSESDSDSETAAGSPSSAAWAALTWLGVGRVPVSLLLMVMFISWGMIGFLLNQVLVQRWSADWRIPATSIPIAVLGATLITRSIARLLGTYMPTRETYARRQHELLGSVGEAMYPIDETFGMAAVRDDRGQLFQVSCRARGGVIEKGHKVRLVGFKSGERTFEVIEAGEC